jgi:hypothetical protein
VESARQARDECTARNATSCASPCHERAHVLVTFLDFGAGRSCCSRLHLFTGTPSFVPLPLAGNAVQVKAVPLLSSHTSLAAARYTSASKKRSWAFFASLATIHSYGIPFVASLGLRCRHTLSASSNCADSFKSWSIGNVTLSSRRVHSTRTCYCSALVPMLVPALR